MVTPLVILYLKVKIYKIMKRSQLRNIIRKSIKEMMGEKQPLNEIANCNWNGNEPGSSECQCIGVDGEGGGCPTITVSGDCRSGNGKFNGFRSCRRYCQSGCFANVVPLTPYNPNKPTGIIGKKKKWCRCGKMRNQMTYCKGNKSCDVCCQKAGHEGGIEDN
tara:strand:- start:740 stop:1225 length:486 start_codon:yes stop_codon:yes gene_type:complete